MDSTTDGGLESVAAEKSEIDARSLKDEEPIIHNLAANESSEEFTRGVKRPADGEPDEEDDGVEGEDVQITTEGEIPLSKNQQRKLKRQKLWDERKQERVIKRKEKRKDKQERKRVEREAEVARAAEEGRDPIMPRRERDRDPKKQTKVPVTIIIDCQFEDQMIDKELISLSSQVARCYSDFRMAKFPVHLYVSSYGGQLKERYENVLGGQNKKWRNIQFSEEDFVNTAKAAKEVMTGEKGGTMIELLKTSESNHSLSYTEPEPDTKSKKPSEIPEPEPESDDVDKSIVYLTADSPYTLDHLEPNTSYIVGGIIDRNRHKGLCYKIARERNVRTAKLPIGEYMILQDRHVLATNHVVEIMLHWLELGDWGAAFMKVIPTRKGAKLKEDGSAASEAGVECDEGKPGEDVQEATEVA
jgi:tRNA (guanine9-N1)-methyltransferase